ncbi:MAG: hypothetical protein K0S46_767 [Moraxellaceae bacterium]|jgi:hypothetical protein|nr:hypothetical protein [Moraxellaceae bacterium]
MSRRLLPPLFLLLLSLSPALRAVEPPARQLATELLVMTGTAAVLDSPRGRAALADPMPFLGDAGHLRRTRLLEEAGLRQWSPPRVWLLQARREGDVERWQSMAVQFQAAAGARGYTLVDTAPLPAAEQAISLLPPGTMPAGLASLLGAYGADAIVLVRGEGWSLWTPGLALQGRLAQRQASLLPQVLAEVLSGLQQWPEAAGEPVVEVAGVSDFASQARVLQALQALPALRQARLVRVEKGRATYTVPDMLPDALSVVLDGEPRLPAVVAARSGVMPAGAEEARQLACPLLRREWTPEAAPRLPEGQAAPVQSPPPGR